MNELVSGKPYIITVHNVLTSNECAEMIQRIESLKPEVATINTVRGKQVNRSVRNNDRVIFEDFELAQKLLERVLNDVPTDLNGMSLVGANECFRCYRYQKGMRFAPHADGAFHRDDQEQSWYSFLVYLNDDFEGGSTTFLTEPEVVIRPETGMALLFQHPIIHEGSLVTSGTKYVARTDLMYRKPVE